jgi:hypothetical protein
MSDVRSAESVTRAGELRRAVETDAFEIIDYSAPRVSPAQESGEWRGR